MQENNDSKLFASNLRHLPGYLLWEVIQAHFKFFSTILEICLDIYWKQCI